MHYVNLTSVGEDAHEVLLQLLKAVHGFNAPREPNNRIAIAFPAMLDAIIDERGKVLQMPRCGAQLRVIGEKELLDEFVASVVPARAARLGMIARGPVTSVPEHAGAVRFVRDRRFERKHPNGSYARRQALRAAAQNREYSTSKPPVAPETVSFVLESKSSNRTFHLDVRKELTNKSVSLTNVTAYGLCGEGTVVPAF